MTIGRRILWSLLILAGVGVMLEGTSVPVHPVADLRVARARRSAATERTHRDGRELRMIELKKEINQWRILAGQGARYPLAFEKEKK